MKSQTSLSALNLQSFYNFAKMDKEGQGQLLAEQGIFLDVDTEKETTTRLYFLQGFFVEEIVCRNLNVVLDRIPYKQGYKIESFISKNNVDKNFFTFQCCMN